ncbi:NADH-ubiquinone oxidoreductase-F iron-sulfur binding region domain-containing protein [Curvivirga aplysinae]|uniref:NADH-ubiquinone oxidoreductase-F iron-sulfur binding region domain-containing protein n=1 Tax=Curvivirga aplysinae TaxID=2529852 RepID=UPI0012BC9E98|nr:NADH-ubiquinone oxidoreductase-F iron-sulfur binding region domain-containing protein [Curvivirga aplysinae]MTI08637.1 NADH-quinone oxidoreductase subunit F [Curvivirga aplysinae]
MGETHKSDENGKVNRFRSPGFGRRKAVPHPKGRQLNSTAHDEVLELLSEDSRQRNMLIENLHLIQDKFGHLSAAHLHALAHEMRLSQAEVYEVASFYAHFDIVLEDEVAPPPLTIRVCDSLSCEMKGAQDLLRNLPDAAGQEVRVLRAPCMGRCHQAPVAEVGHNHVTDATVEKLIEAAEKGDTHHAKPNYEDFDKYKSNGGYAILEKCVSGNLTVEQVIETMEGSGLRGLGGAGFPTGRKWKFVRMEPKPRLMAVNGDEGEPGTIKDHHYLTRKPHQFLEGMLIGAWAVEAEAVYIYIRDEYPDVIALLKDEIAKIEAAGLSKHTKLHLRRGAGAYICGEESAMIESIEGKKGLPRHRPPFVAQKGIFDRPTLVNNVESLYWVPEILEKGGEWFASHGANDRKGLRSFSVSGRVKEPGVKLAPAGITIQQLIDDYCGGMLNGHELKAYLPGGPSGGIFPAKMNDIPLDFDTLQPFGGFIGSAAVMVLSNHDSVKDAALNLMKFFEDESCGQCTPCRVGTEKAVKLMETPSWDTGLLEQLCDTMADASICGLGQAAPNPIRSLLKYFPEEVPN